MDISRRIELTRQAMAETEASIADLDAKIVEAGDDAAMVEVLNDWRGVLVKSNEDWQPVLDKLLARAEQ